MKKNQTKVSISKFSKIKKDLKKGIQKSPFLLTSRFMKLRIIFVN